MKNYILTIICLFLLIDFLFGQNNNSQQSLKDSTYWKTYDIDTRTNRIKYTSLTFLNGDTMIQDAVYKKLFIDDEGYCGAIRESGSKVYANNLIYFESNITEGLLYDFSVNVGDTIRSAISAGILSDSPIVTKIDTVLLYNNEKRKRIYLFDGADIWIEGIGSIYGFLSPALFHATNYTATYLVCFKQDDEIKFKNDTLCNYNCCNTEIDMELEYNISSNSFNYYPNPTTGIINIEFVKANNTFEIINASGQRVFSDETSEKNYNLDTSDFSSGLYFLKVKNKNNVWIKKVIFN